MPISPYRRATVKAMSERHQTKQRIGEVRSSLLSQRLGCFESQAASRRPYRGQQAGPKHQHGYHRYKETALSAEEITTALRIQ